MIKIKNKNRLISRLKNLSEASQLPVKQTVFKSALKIENDTKKLIATGSRSGVIDSRGGITFRRSAPVEPPKTDTGRLVSSIKKTKFKNGFEYLVGTNVTYGRFLEFGTTKMLPRPWLQPTFLKNKKEITKNIDNSVKKALRKAIK